jgi:protein-tyrosine-phosphatase
MMTIFNRRALIAAFLVAAALPQILAAQSTAHSPKILFVCQMGTVKSPIARELLKRRATQRGMVVEVKARGITPEPHLSESLRQTLAADGIDAAAEPLEKLTAADVASADLVIVFDKLPPAFRPRAEWDWSDLPSMLNDYAKARADLDRRIDSLLDGLAAGH